MYYPLSKKKFETDERDNIITQKTVKDNQFTIEYSLTPFRSDKAIDIIKKFQESEKNMFDFSNRMELCELLNECVMRFKTNKI